MYKERMEEKSFRVYVTDALKFITENTARFAGGSYKQERWHDAWNDAMTKKPDNRTGDEIAADIILRIAGGG